MNVAEQMRRRRRRVAGGGLDVVVETAGAVPAMEMATRLAREGGRVVAPRNRRTGQELTLPADRIALARPHHPRQRRLHDGCLGADGRPATRRPRRPRPDRHAPIPARAVRGRVRADGRPARRRRARSCSSTRPDADRPHHDRRRRGELRLDDRPRRERRGLLRAGARRSARRGSTQTIRELAPLLDGEDARQVEPLVRKLHLATAHVSSGGTVYHAISGIEAALWDLAARSLEVPLWRLFGGRFRDRVRIYADCHAGEALTSYGAIARLAAAALDGEPPDELDEARPEVHWAPAGRGRRLHAGGLRAARGEMADRGFTALKFDLDLPLLPHEDLYARTISAAQLERQVALAEADGRSRRRPSRRRVRPALALRAGGRAPARARARAPAAPLARGPDAAAGPRVGRADRGAHDDADLHRREPLPARRLRRADRPRRRRHPRARHPEGRRAQRHAADRRLRRRPLASDRAAQHRRRRSGRSPRRTSARRSRTSSRSSGTRRRVPFFDDLVTLGRPVIEDGYITLPDGAGIGAELDLDACRRYARPGEPFFDEPAVLP